MTEPWWVYLIALGGSAWLSLFFHEGAHVVAYYLSGARVVEFKPYPNKDANGQWWIGRTRWVDGTLRRYHHSAPLYADLIVGGAALTVGLLLWQPALVLAVTSAVDALNWVRGFFGLGYKNPERIDGWKWRHYSS